jgi:plasmid replication initiation protein
MAGKRRRSQIVIRKSNRLVEAKYKLDIWEMRVFTKALSMIRKDDGEFQTYRIYLSDMIEEFGLVKGLSYKYLKQAAKSLNKRTVILERDTDGGKREFQTSIVTGVDSAIEGNESTDSLYIEIDFHKNLRDSLLELKREFTVYDIRNVARLSSSYSYRVYELLKQYEKIGIRTFDLKELKEQVGAIEFLGDGSPPIDHYPMYGNFRQKVLLKAQNDLRDNTDIRFTFEPIKRGRRVSGVTFLIYSNVSEEPESDHIEATDLALSLFERIFPLMKGWEDIDEKSVKTLIKRYGEKRVLAAYEQTQVAINKGSIRSSKGNYFYALVHNAPSLHEKTQQAKEVFAEHMRAKQIKEKESQLLQEQISRLETVRDDLRARILEHISTNYINEYDLAKNMLMKSKVYNRELTLDENMKRPAMKAGLWLKLMELLPGEMGSFNAIEEEIKRLKER